MSEDTQATDAVEQAPDASQLQPGQINIDVNAQGVILALLAPVRFGLSEEIMSKIIPDYLNQHLALWDALVTERVQMLRANKSHLALVTDSATVRKVARSKQGKA